MLNRLLSKRLSRFCPAALSRAYSSKGTLSSLRPFYMAVHPDFLWQHPSKKEVNENSLKQLNQFIENLHNKTHHPGPSTLQFYLKTSDNDADHTLVDIKLDCTSMDKTIQNILCSCRLPIDLPENPLHLDLPLGAEEESVKNKCLFYKKLPKLQEETLKKRIIKSQKMNLNKFLSEKVAKAHGLMQGLHHTKRAVFLHTEQMKAHLRLRDIIWDNKCTSCQNRNCIEDLSRLSNQYRLEMDYLAGRTLVFGNETGIFLNGDISFGCSDSRRLWVNLLQEIPEKNQVLLEIWKSEARLMDQLKGTKVVHLPKPCLEVEMYLYWLQKLSYILEQSNVTKDFLEVPSNTSLRIILDCNSDKMEVFNTGDVSLCPQLPVSEIVAFLNTNAEKAFKNQTEYKRTLLKEQDIHQKCVVSNSLGFLYKDETLCPEKMITCCKNLIENRKHLEKLLQNLHICVSTYYCGSEDAVLCIPWNFKCSELKL